MLLLVQLKILKTKTYRKLLLSSTLSNSLLKLFHFFLPPGSVITESAVRAIQQKGPPTPPLPKMPPPPNMLASALHDLDPKWIPPHCPKNFGDPKPSISTTLSMNAARKSLARSKRLQQGGGSASASSLNQSHSSSALLRPSSRSRSTSPSGRASPPPTNGSDPLLSRRPPFWVSAPPTVDGDHLRQQIANTYPLSPQPYRNAALYTCGALPVQYFEDSAPSSISNHNSRTISNTSVGLHPPDKVDWEKASGSLKTREEVRLREKDKALSLLETAREKKDKGWWKKLVAEEDEQGGGASPETNAELRANGGGAAKAAMTAGKAGGGASAPAMSTNKAGQVPPWDSTNRNKVGGLLWRIRESVK